MPARGHVGDTRGRARKAAEVYLQAERDHDSLTIRDVATRFGLNRRSVSGAVKLLREERAGANATARGESAP
jgi:DNA-binding transcriptional regulator LsrR (DeoR family)